MAILKRQDDPSHFGISRTGAGKGDKPRTDTASPKYQGSKLWARSQCCDSKVEWREKEAICRECNNLCETYQK